MSDKASNPPHKTRRFLFLLGRPGSGKSHVFDKVAAVLPGKPTRIDDYPKLKDLAAKDNAREASGEQRQFSKAAGRDWLAPPITQATYDTAKEVDSGWLATQVAYETVLREIDSELQQQLLSKDKGFTFVEFARWDMVRSIQENFSVAVLNRSFLIYIYCPLSICMQRNEARKGTQTTVDQHKVPVDRLLERYRNDDHDVLEQLRVPYIVIDNHLDGIKHLELEARKIAEALGVKK